MSNSLHKPNLRWFCTWTNDTFRPYPKTNTAAAEWSYIFLARVICLPAAAAPFSSHPPHPSRPHLLINMPLYSAFHSAGEIHRRDFDLSPELRAYNATDGAEPAETLSEKLRLQVLWNLCWRRPELQIDVIEGKWHKGGCENHRKRLRARRYAACFVI